MPSLRIPFTRFVRAPAESRYIEESLAGGHLQGDGPFTRKAHALLAAHLDGAKAILTSSCTHALEAMALLFDLAPGDEVVLPSFTFSSTANAVALRGARIRFADIDPDTWTMERPQLEAALTPKTKAVILMPYGGVSRDIEAMVALCEARGIRVGEDAAHALFARKDGRAFGTFAPVAALSFHNTKNISCGEGGALVVRDPAAFERALVFREKGTDRSRFLRGEIDKYTWRDIGSSWLPSDLLAAVLCAQLEHAEMMQAARQRAWTVYQRALTPHAERLGFRLQEIPTGLEHPAHVFGVVVTTPEQRKAILAGMVARGIGCVSHYEPLHVAPAGKRYGEGSPPLPITEHVAPRLVRLPLYSSLDEESAREVAETFLELAGATRAAA